MHMSTLGCDASSVNINSCATDPDLLTICEHKQIYQLKWVHLEIVARGFVLNACDQLFLTTT